MAELLRATLAAFLAGAAALPAHAACTTEADMAAAYRQADPDIRIVPYRGLAATYFARAFTDVSGTTVYLGRTKAAVTYSPSDGNLPVGIIFYDDQGCEFWASRGSPKALQVVLAAMGVGA